MATTWDPSNKSANISLFRSNLLAASGVTSGTWKGVRATTSLSSGKKIVEYYISGYKGDNGWLVGFGNSSFNTAAYPGADGNSFGYQPAIASLYGISGAVATATFGYVIQFAIDLTAKLVWIRTDRDQRWNLSGTADPATGTGGKSYTVTGALFPVWSGFDDILGNQCSLNAGGINFSLSVPSGFSAWDSAVPTVGGKTGGPTSTFDPGNKDSHVTLSNGNLTAANTSAIASYFGVKSNDTYGGGKVYCEITVNSLVNAANSPIFMALVRSGQSLTVNPGQDYLSSGLQIGGSNGFTGAYVNGARVMAASTWNTASGDKIAFAFDLDKGLWWAKNLTQSTNWNADAIGDPVNGIGGWALQAAATDLYLQCSLNAINGSVTNSINFGAAAFTGTIPSGYSRWDALGTTGAVGAIAGTSTVTGVGKEYHKGTGAIVGVAALAGISKEFHVGAGTLAGTSSLLGVGSSTSGHKGQPAVTIIT